MNTNTYHYSGQKIGPLSIKTHPYSILQVPTTQLAKMSIDLKFVELTADVLEIFFIKYVLNTASYVSGKTAYSVFLLLILAGSSIIRRTSC